MTYKIVSACIASRINNILDFLIHYSQKGFLKGRITGVNRRIINYVIDIARDKHIPGMMLLIDFEKAFDFISWKFYLKKFSLCLYLLSNKQMGCTLCVMNIQN